MSLDNLQSRLKGIKMKNHRQGVALCPSHADIEPSLSFAQGRNGTLLLKCFGGCKTEDVLKDLRMSWGDLFPSNKGVDYGSSKTRSGN